LPATGSIMVDGIDTPSDDSDEIDYLPKCHSDYMVVLQQQSRICIIQYW
jgi:hypothetical protein